MCLKQITTFSDKEHFTNAFYLFKNSINNFHFHVRFYFIFISVNYIFLYEHLSAEASGSQVRVQGGALETV